MVRKFVASMLVVAGLGVMAFAISDGRAFGQAATTGAGTNACCVRASTLPVVGGTCGILQGGDQGTKKDLFCNLDPNCPATIVTLGGTKEAPVITQSLHSDSTQTGGCVRQGLKVCSTGSTVGLLVRRGIKRCQSGLVKSSSTSQIACLCVFESQGASIINVANCTGSLCQ
jgi:hypothetical protein